MRRICALLLEVVVIVCASVSVFFLSDTVAIWGRLLYFTNQSNIWIALVMACLLALSLKGKDEPHWLYRLHYMSMVSILLTFLVFTFMLAPTLDAAFLTKPSSLLAHLVVPLASLAHWLWCVKPQDMGKRQCYLSVVYPLWYCAMVIACVALKVTFGEEKSKVPYFFLDWESQHWLMVVWIVLLCVVVVILGKVLLLLQRKANFN